MIKAIILSCIIYLAGILLMNIIDYTIALINKNNSAGKFGYELFMLSVLIGLYSYL